MGSLKNFVINYGILILIDEKFLGEAAKGNILHEWK
jgi:hypothetical protein